MVARARQGARIILFPEGGTTPGEGVGPFKPFLFGSIGGSEVHVQPFTILYTRIDGRPLTLATRDLVYWYRPSEPFLSHGWGVLTLPGITAEITFHDPLPPPISTDKNVLREYAERARRSVAEGVGPLPRG
jgi:1-acyl-sn-glycerol-3-phosphate acyltransferase